MRAEINREFVSSPLAVWGCASTINPTHDNNTGICVTRTLNVILRLSCGSLCSVSITFLGLYFYLKLELVGSRQVL